MNDSLDPYKITPDTIQEPPIKWSDRAKHLGPGFILSASIVGSGELIATTTLGAKAGFVTFWVIIASCLIKVFIQIEFAKHTILKGETAMSLLGRLSGAGNRNWPVALMLLMLLFKFLQVGGIVGGVAIILSLAIPELDTTVWSYIVALVVGLIIFKGYYVLIERTSILLMGLFTLFTASCLVFVFYTPYAFDMNDLIGGLSLSLPREMVPMAVGAFGITGMAGEEILYYNYWCLEKGYARSCGPNDNSDAWRERTKGWIKMMHTDAVVSMVIYTIVTAIFYLLGASVLHSQGMVPEGYEMIETLSAIYTESIGSWAKPVFLVGSFLILFSTLFAALASWTRLFPDIFHQMGWLDFYDYQQRKKVMGFLAFFFPIAWATFFIFIKLPVVMIMIGGIIGSVMLLLVMASAIQLKTRESNAYFKADKVYNLCFWSSVAFITLFALYGIVRILV